MVNLLKDKTMKYIGIWRLIFVAIFALTFVAHAVAEPTTQLPPPLQDFLARQYKVTTNVADLPSDVRTALFERMHFDPRLANPGEHFNSTDVINSKYPMRRLIVAGGSPTSWFICYEHGGYAYHRQLVIFTINAGKPRLEFSGRFFAAVHNYQELKDAVKNRSVPDETGQAEQFGYY
jgi:hypothetical protein